MSAPLSSRETQVEAVLKSTYRVAKILLIDADQDCQIYHVARKVPITVIAASCANPKLFCDRCCRREAFELIESREINRCQYDAKKFDLQSWLNLWPMGDGVQLFAMVYRCFACKNSHTAFLVRREGPRLILEGRSPLESIEVPRHIPKQERILFENALIAYNAGKTLAALFYLRAFIEKFARRQTNAQGRVTGDQLMSDYSGVLPPKLRDFMPSMSEAYADLSACLHEFRDDPSVFEAVRIRIEKHFDLRRVHEIPDGSSESA